MSLNLGAVDRRLLARAPLASVICQVRFEAPEAVSPNSALALRDALGGEQAFPHIERIGQGSSFSVSLGPGGPSAQPGQPSQGWRIRNAERTRVVALLPNAVTLEVFEYHGWEQAFAPALTDVLEALANTVKPVFEQRLGLRYINQLKVPEDVRRPEQWGGFISPSFLSLASDPEVGPMVEVTRQQTVLAIDDGVKCIVNHGFAADDDRDGALTYVLDFDVYRESLREFDPAGIMAAANTFNRVALRLFQLATTQELRELLAT